MKHDDFDLNQLRRRKHAKRGVTILAWLLAPALALGLTLYGFSTSIDLFLTPSQVTSQAKPGESFRLGGLVMVDSCYQSEGLNIEFAVTDGGETIDVLYNGILPDLFREGQGVIAMGYLQPDGNFRAKQLLAKHDETYIPREVVEALKENHIDPKAKASDTQGLSQQDIAERAAIMAKPKCKTRIK